MSLPEFELQQQLSAILPLPEGELEQIISHAASLPETESTSYFRDLLGDSAQSEKFIRAFSDFRPQLNGGVAQHPVDQKTQNMASTASAPPSAPPSYDHVDSKSGPRTDVKSNGLAAGSGASSQAPTFAPPTMPRPTGSTSRVSARHHTNPVIEAGKVRAKDEQEMQQALQNLQYRYGIYNSDVEPEHETDYPCGCPICNYRRAKWRRYPVQEMWARAVMYPGEKYYNDNKNNYGYGMGSGSTIFNRNPYMWKVVSPYGYNQWTYGPQRPKPSWHARNINQTISLNNQLNREAQTNIDAKEPKHSIWDNDALEKVMTNMSIGDRKKSIRGTGDLKQQPSEEPTDRRASLAPSASETKPSGFSKLRKSMGIKSSEERAVGKAEKAVGQGEGLRNEILTEENGRWPDEMWRNTVMNYQAKVGMTAKIADLRNRHPIQYLHLLRAGYFEPIPVAWANQNSNPLKFSIEASAGWRGITPAWRGYEDTAEERLYWVLNHRENPEGATLTRLKPDFISEMNMARERMAKAVEPPPLYFDPQDTCHVQHTSEGYSKQVAPPPFRPYDRPETAADDTMVLLDVSGSMDFDPVRPVYDQYLVTRYERSTQPKNKDVAKAIIRRFTDAMANHDHQSAGYDLITFSSSSKYIGTVNHQNLDQMWSTVRIGGGTRVMTGWQKVKELHFQKHSESATYHPIYGWQAGPDTPMLRLLLLLDGEATDMDEFELDVLSLSWAHVTIFLIGVDGCPHHHRHANELSRISDVNHHVSFVDAQGNTPERYVTHELLKRHLGYDVSMQEFQEMEQLPAYSA